MIEPTMKFLSKIQITNFKSFTSEIISLDSSTCIVGANESGKSNLLDAIYHLANRNQDVPFHPDELRNGAPGYPQGKIEIKYTLSIEQILLGEAIKIFPGIKGKEVFLTKSGVPQQDPDWIVSSNIPQSSIPDIIRINSKTKFVSSFKGDAEAIKIAKKHVKAGWFINDKTIDLRKTPYKQLIDEGKIEIFKKEKKIDFLNDTLGELILSNIKIFKWKFKEEDFLQENVIIEDLIKSPKKYKSVTRMFLIAGWKTKDFSSNLQNQTTMVYSNLLGEVERQINALIKNQWSSHQKLKIKINHSGDRLIIHLQEPGSNTPPEFRSDGLKWFLTFLINFRAQSKYIKNYILLIDEPGLYLHPKGQKDVLMELVKLSKDNQIVYSTHQTFLINKNEPNSVRVIQRETDKGSGVSGKPFYASRVKGISDSKNILTDKLLREALGFQVSDISPINEKNILVEGVFDRELIHIFNQTWKTLDFNEISVIACNGASEIAKHCNWYLSNGLKVICLYDSDSVGLSANNSNKRIAKALKLQINQFGSDTNFLTIEDLIPDKVFTLGIIDWTKQWKINCPATINRPRMKDIEKFLDPQKKKEMKHSLEDILLAKVKLDFPTNKTNYDGFKKILNEIKTKF
jgi:predicted ATP-dependent endonuclease of OLD family